MITHYVTWNGEQAEEAEGPITAGLSVEEIDDDVVSVVAVDGHRYVFRTSKGHGGVGYKIDDNGVLSIQVQQSTALLRSYSPSGWWSIDGVSAKHKGKPGRAYVLS